MEIMSVRLFVTKYERLHPLSILVRCVTGVLYRFSIVCKFHENLLRDCRTLFRV